MKRTIPVVWTALVLVWHSVAVFSALATEGGGRDVGNGGGVWTCRQGRFETGRLRSVQLVDLFEGRTERSLAIPSTSELSVDALLEQVAQKIQAVNSSYFQSYSRHLERVKQNLRVQPGLDLVEIDDALYSSRPARETCEGGRIRYEQLANYRADGLILVDQSLWARLSVIDQAALYVHEAVYALQREEEQVQDSRNARRLTAHLFSDQEAALYRNLLQLPYHDYPRPVPRAGVYVAENAPLNCAYRVRVVTEAPLTFWVDLLDSPIGGATCQAPPHSSFLVRCVNTSVRSTCRTANRMDFGMIQPFSTTDFRYYWNDSHDQYAAPERVQYHWYSE